MTSAHSKSSADKYLIGVESNEEQYHSKMAYLRAQDQSYVTLGSTNFTSRNLDDYNLENNLVVIAPNESEFIESIDGYFKRIWHNEDATFTVPYVVEKEEQLGFLKSIIYWLQQALRLTTY